MRTLRAIAAGVLALGALLGTGLALYPLAYHGRVVPGVAVRDIDLGGLTAEQAVLVLRERLPNPSGQHLVLRAGEHAWSISWADVGQQYDHNGTAQAAMQVSRQGSWWARLQAAWHSRLDGVSLEPLVTPADPAQVASILARAAPLIARPATEANLVIGPAGVVATDGKPGIALDIEASTARLLAALAEGATEVELATQPVLPRLAQPQPARDQAEALLAQPFVLIADDMPTDTYAEFAADRERMVTWLRAVPEVSDETARMVLEIDETAVAGWLADIAPSLGPERVLSITETLPLVLDALAAGEHQARARIHHPAQRYVVQPGDNLFDIAYRFGFPRWRLEEANPAIDPDALEIGMELVIPSMDVLLPHPVVPGKLIEINLPEQKLRAYEHGQLMYEFTCSSGMSSTPTIAGQFQVLMKEEMAYAQRWDLQMPYFMGIYQEGPDFYNGIHELPILSSGRRLWANVLGWPASYGCIILNIGDAETLYHWAPIGTLVRIYGVAPGTPVYREAEPASEPEAEAEAPALDEAPPPDEAAAH